MAKTQKICGRFAPSPSGRMHLGNLFAALLAWLDVRSQKGDMLLRMEDLDPDRCRPEYALQLADDLSWFGLDWDFGWQPGEEAFLQSRRTEVYREAFEGLRDRGLLYPCYCNRKERLAASAPHAADGSILYEGRCRDLSQKERQAFEAAGRRPAWRIRVPEETVAFRDGSYGCYEENLAKDCGDFILRRADGVYAYQLAVVVDDGFMGVSRVVRGRDLLSSAPRQIWLAGLLGYKAPTYCHTPLLTDAQGRRLSKRDEDLDLGLLRQETTPEMLCGYLAHRAGLIDRWEPLKPRDLIQDFTWEKIGREDLVMESRLPTFPGP